MTLQPNNPAATSVALMASPAAPSRSPPWRRRIASLGTWEIGLTVAFLTLNTLLVFHHVMWRDEWGVWLVAKERAFSDFWEQTRCRGSPIGWTLCAWVLARLGTYPWGLKILHISIATSSVYVVASRSPFSRLQKLLFAFGYFPLYEWGTIMRPYAMSMLALIVACHYLCARPRRPIAFGIAIAVATQSTAFANIVGAVLGATYLLDLFMNRKKEPFRPLVPRLLVGLSIALVGFAFAGFFAHPDYALRPPVWYNPSDANQWLANGFRNIWIGDCPIPWQGIWDTNILAPFPTAQLVMGIVIAITAVCLVAQRPTALLFYVVSTVGLVIFGLFSKVYAGQVRHQGYMYLVLILTFWIYAKSPAIDLERLRLPKWRVGWTNPLPTLITGMLGIQLVAAAILCIEEQAIPFSGCFAAAEMIRQKAPPGSMIVGDQDFAMTPVSGYLDEPIYIPYRREFLTYWLEDKKLQRPPSTPAQIAEAIQTVMSTHHCDVVLVLNHQLELSGDNVKLLGVVSESMVPDERYLLYWIRYRSPG
jgi:hypothetical protein